MSCSASSSTLEEALPANIYETEEMDENIRIVSN